MSKQGEVWWLWVDCHTHTESRKPGEAGPWGLWYEVGGPSSTLARDVQGPPPQKPPHIPQQLLRNLFGAAEAKGKMQK